MLVDLSPCSIHFSKHLLFASHANLRQVFGRHKTPSEVCLLFANNNLLSIEVVAVLGDSHDSVRKNFAMLIGGEDVLGNSDQVKTLRLIQVIAVWISCSHLNACTAQRRAKMEEP